MIGCTQARRMRTELITNATMHGRISGSEMIGCTQNRRMRTELITKETWHGHYEEEITINK